MKLYQLKAIFAIGLALASGPLASGGAFAADATILPPPEQLVTMSIQQRLSLFQSMQSLPANQRDANLNALRAEIDSLSPRQKQEMSDRFTAELSAMPADQQESLRQQLASLQQMAPK